MTSKIQRRYTEEFHAEAVRLVRDAAPPVTHVARALGIADHLRYRWRTEQHQAESQGHPHTPINACGTGGASTAATRERDLEPGARFFTTCGGVLRAGVAMRDRVIQAHDRRDPIRLVSRVFGWALCLAVAAREYPIGGESGSLDQHSAPPSGETPDLRQSSDFGSAACPRPASGGTSRGAAHAPGGSASQDCHEVASAHGHGPSLSRGRQSPEPAIYRHRSESDVGRCQGQSWLSINHRSEMSTVHR